MKKIFIFLSLLYSSSVYAYYNETIQDKCGVLPNRLHTIFTINKYTCDTGYFLPANALGCEPCPADHTCSGGTFKFNPTQSQGINYHLLTQKASKACAENGPHRLNTIFTPNILTLNWDYKDDTGRIEQTTCEYGMDIKLPPLPVRQGYKFMGWRVKLSD